MIEGTCSFVTSVHFKRNARRYIPGTRTLRYGRSEHLDSYIIEDSYSVKDVEFPDQRLSLLKKDSGHALLLLPIE
jgi:hypothetical protein